MTPSPPQAPGGIRPTTAEILLDGLITGMLGALAVAVWFLVLDTLRGHPLLTPALLGNVLLHGGSAVAGTVTVMPLEVAAYTGFHFVAFAVAGVIFAYLMALFERLPIVFFVLVLLFVFLEVGFVSLSMALHLEAPGYLPGWSVIVANLLASGAMGAYQLRRHPGALGRVESLWAQRE